MMGRMTRTARLPTCWDVTASVAEPYHKSHVEERGGGTPHAAEIWTPASQEYAGLGKSAGLVFARLTADPLEPSELADVTGKHRTTVWRALKRLEGWGLAERGPDGWTRGPASLVDVMEELDAEGRARQRHQEHELQRAGWDERRGTARIGRADAGEGPADVVQDDQDQVDGDQVDKVDKVQEPRTYGVSVLQVLQEGGYLQ